MLSNMFMEWRVRKLNTNTAEIRRIESSPSRNNKMSSFRLSHHKLPGLIIILVVFLIVAINIDCYDIKRTQYHEQGVHGPKSYKFGYTSGDHKNPQERHEVSDGHGHVKGWYSFVDANGKHQVVHYEAHPKHGFKVLNHNAKAYNNGKRHYGS